MNPDVKLNGSPLITRNLEFNDLNMDRDYPPFDKPGNANHEFDMDDGFSDHMGPYNSDDEENDPWKSLNPHEPGNLKTRPFKKGSLKFGLLFTSIIVLLLKFDSPIHDDDRPNMMDEDTPIFDDKQTNDIGGFDKNEDFEREDLQSQPNLEDLCRSHLDALLASISEAEKLTEIAARVSSWKQRIEHNLEEQESRPPFDIHYYGDRILDTLSIKTHDENVTSFRDVVGGQEKHDIARSLSALLELVNNGDVDLERDRSDDNSTCYIGVNPFHVRLLRHDKRLEDLQIRSSKKRFKSPTKRVPAKCDAGKAQQEKPIPTADSLGF